MKAVLFDCDGVVADTMGDHAEAWVRAFQEEGLMLDKTWVYEGEGVPTRDLVRNFMERLGAVFGDVATRELGVRKERYFIETHRSRVYPEMRDILARIEERRLPAALVSGAARATLDRSLPPDLIMKFQVVVSGDDVVRGKPSPEPYLKAAGILGVEPPNCLVIENAPMGIRAAKAAGMRCVALCTTLDARHLAEADVVLSNHAELARRLDDLLQKLPDRDPKGA